MVAISSNASSASSSRNKPHLTVRLVLELMAADCCASHRRRTGPHAAVAPAPAAAAVEVDEESLRAALQRSLLAASQLHLNDSAGSDERLLQQLLSSPASQFDSDSMSPAIATIRHDSSSSCCDEQSVGSAGSWEEEDQWEEDSCDYLAEDRGRLGAAARSGDLSLDDERLSALADRGGDCCGGSSW